MILSFCVLLKRQEKKNSSKKSWEMLIANLKNFFFQNQESKKKKKLFSVCCKYFLLLISSAVIFWNLFIWKTHLYLCLFVEEFIKLWTQVCSPVTSGFLYMKWGLFPNEVWFLAPFANQMMQWLPVEFLAFLSLNCEDIFHK